MRQLLRAALPDVELEYELMGNGEPVVLVHHRRTRIAAECPRLTQRWVAGRAE
jgi:hypothetical protein